MARETMDGGHVLLVEDNYGDVNLIERAFDGRSLPGELHAVQTGGEALDWLYGREAFADAPRLDLVLLDLNLPATSGHDVLEVVASDPELDGVPIVVLTGSRSDEDVAAAYDNGANAYLVKPVDPEAFADLVETTVEFWTSAETPPAARDTGDGE